MIRASAPSGLLRSRTFDGVFIIGVLALALLAGALMVARPELAATILLLDVWILGYHHVVATLTRVCFDRASFRRHRFLVLFLPLIVMACVSGLVIGFGVWTVFSLYFYWQWFHYTRQSWGISQAWRRAASPLVPPAPDRLLTAAMYLVPIWAVLHRMTAGGSNHLLGMSIVMPAIPHPIVDITGVLALAAVAGWLVLRATAARSLMHTLYVSSHIAVFSVGYVLIGDLTTGWLVMNVWHNAQYILFVWHNNNRRFEGRPDPGRRLLSFISQRRHAVLYFGSCVVLSSVFYLTVRSGLGLLTVPVLISGAIVYQTINFHHYIVDAVIWRSPRGPGAAVAGPGPFRMLSGFRR